MICCAAYPAESKYIKKQTIFVNKGLATAPFLRSNIFISSNNHYDETRLPYNYSFMSIIVLHKQRETKV